MRKPIVWAALKYSVGYAHSMEWNQNNFCQHLKKIRSGLRIPHGHFVAFETDLYSNQLPNKSKLMIRQSLRKMRLEIS